MKQSVVLLPLALMAAGTAQAQDSIFLSKTEAKSMITSYSMSRVSVHDPSITWNSADQTYYIFGTHRAKAKSTDLKNWTGFQAPWGRVNANGTVTNDVANSEAFSRQQVTTVTIGGKTVEFPNFDALGWSAGGDDDYSVDGNMWAPDIIYNPVLKKWCMYLSINGDNWKSGIILLTADEIDGTYVYQAPVVTSGFINTTDSNYSYTKTDLQLALGTLSALPSRYNKGSGWGSYWPNCIDPCVFYDEDGNLWMSYGSWSGGIWMLQLDENTGLRDYDVTYASDYDSKGGAVTSDPYFGKKIAGGCYVSGEGSYIEHIGNNYYLFVTYGGLESTGGYEMRVFRSANPDGPYLDSNGTNAIFTSWALNYGLNSDTRGEKIIGSYGGWGNMTVGETAQGHNSCLDAEDGNTYLVYHTRFHHNVNVTNEGFEDRVHQLFLNQYGWPVAAPFEYTGETVGNAAIAASTQFSDDEITGTYQLLVHKYRMDHANMEQVEPVTIHLNADGSVSGAYSGSWATVAGTSYINVTLGGTLYRGVCVEQEMEKQTTKAVCFTAASTAGVNVWGYKVRDDYRLAMQLNQTTLPVVNRRSVSANVNLYGIDLLDDVQLSWASLSPGILSSDGLYNPAGLEADSLVNLIVRLSCGKYYWSDTITVNVKAESIPDGDWTGGIAAYYNFDSTPIANSYNAEEVAQLKKRLTTQLGYLDSDRERNGQFLHLNYGAQRRECYAIFTNPLYEQAVDSGVTIAFWVKRAADDGYPALWSFYDSDASSTLCMGGNTYLHFDDGNGTTLDINSPDTLTTTLIPADAWTHVAITISRTEGITYYINGARKYVERYKGDMNGTAVSREADFDFNKMIDHIAGCANFYLGYGGSNGSAEASYDDLLIYGRVLTVTDVKGLYKMATRVNDFGPQAVGISMPKADIPAAPGEGIYDLQGRRVTHPSHGLYIVNGRKVLIP